VSYSEYKSIDDFKEKSGYTIDGLWYPRVTKIVGIKAKPALYKYYGEAKSYETAQAATEASAKEGTLIHETMQSFLIGKKPEIHPSISPAINAAINFSEKYGIEIDPDFIEKRIMSVEHRYAGTIDAVARISGKIGVLDIKTSQSIYRDYNLQTSAYMNVLTRDLPYLTTRWIFRIDQIKTCLTCGATMRLKGGNEKIRERGNSCSKELHNWSDLTGVCELKEMPYWKDDFEAFLAAKKLWEWENFFWLQKINY